MPAPLTLITELATAWGILGDGEASMPTTRPERLLGVSDAEWDRFLELGHSPTLQGPMQSAHVNGTAFRRSTDGLNSRMPLSVEWTGNRRPVGDEYVPADLRVDRVYLVSCKYLSRILHNASPARIFEGHLTQRYTESGRQDWFAAVAPDSYRDLLVQSAALTGIRIPKETTELGGLERAALREALKGGWPSELRPLYNEMCSTVAHESARRWMEGLDRRERLLLFLRLLRIGTTTYFILGQGRTGPIRLRIDSAWDWQQRYELIDLHAVPHQAGQSVVDWTADYRDRTTGTPGSVNGHVEIRWSHGRFAQAPEAKVYLDTPHSSVAGYHPLAAHSSDAPSTHVLRTAQERLFSDSP